MFLMKLKCQLIDPTPCKFLLLFNRRSKVANLPTILSHVPAPYPVEVEKPYPVEVVKHVKVPVHVQVDR